MKGKATNASTMKSKNKQLLLKRIFKEPLSRAELARETGLTRAAVSIIVDELISDNLVMESGIAHAVVGRKPILLDINPISRYVVGIDIARNSYSAGVVSLKGQVLVKREMPVSDMENPVEVISLLSQEVNKMLNELSIEQTKVIGMGVSSPGPVDIFSGKILNPPDFDRWHNVSIVDEFKKYFSWDVTLDNNAVALALTEKNQDTSKNLNSFLLLVVEWGIGAGIIINDKIYRGAGGFGSEIGHTTVDINGLKCGCGNYGCLELYASIPAVLRIANQKDKSLHSWRNIIDKSEEGDPFCIEMVEYEARYLAAVIVNTMNLLELEGVILAGHIHYKPEMLMNKIRRYAENQLITRNMRELKLYSSPISYDDKVVSAAMIQLEKFYNGELLRGAGDLNEA